MTRPNVSPRSTALRQGACKDHHKIWACILVTMAMRWREIWRISRATRIIPLMDSTTSTMVNLVFAKLEVFILSLFRCWEFRFNEIIVGFCRSVKWDEQLSWSDEEKTTSIQDNVHFISVGRTRKGIPEDALSGRLLQRRACVADRPHGSESPG